MRVKSDTSGKPTSSSAWKQSMLPSAHYKSAILAQWGYIKFSWLMVSDPPIKWRQTVGEKQFCGLSSYILTIDELLTLLEAHLILPASFPNIFGWILWAALRASHARKAGYSSYKEIPYPLFGPLKTVAILGLWMPHVDCALYVEILYVCLSSCVLYLYPPPLQGVQGDPHSGSVW